MHRLHAIDAEFLHIEDECSPMHIAALCVFEGSAPSNADFVRLLAAKLHYLPRYRQRVRVPPLELGRPVWVDDPDFDLNYHVRRTALPAPGDDASLCTLMGRLMSQQLDRERPLWETWIVEGLENGRWALVTKVHHCMVDGVSGLDLLGITLDVDRESSLPQPVPWKPEPAPSGVELVWDAWSGLAEDAASWGRRLRAHTAHPENATKAAVETGQGLLMFARRLLTVPLSSLEGTIGSHRAYAYSSAQLADVRAVRKAYGGTLNDVVLAAIAGGFRTLMIHRGEDADGATLRTMVPVSVRKPEASGTLGNRVSTVLCDLPVHLSDPLARLVAVQCDMDALKASHMAEAGELLTELWDLAPPMLLGSMSRLVTRLMHRVPQRTVHTIATNIPGPQFPLYCLGRQMLASYPYVPITQGIRVATAILSYNGQLSFGVTGDLDSAPDVDVLAQAVVSEIAELRSLAALAEQQPSSQERREEVPHPELPGRGRP
ncbi:MAG TPA: wax ester/triacylglycerol synthase family O-acyltransferase [Polyangiaceae bacterium]